MTQTLAAVEQYLDRRLSIDEHSDRTGNGLLVSGRETVHRIGASLNTSFSAIDAASAGAVDLLLVHHAPWAEIDLDLRERKLQRLREHGISLYAAHESLDRSAGESTGGTLALRLGLTLERAGGEDLAIGTAPSMAFDAWLLRISESLQTRVRAWPNSTTFHRVAVVPGGGGATHYLARAASLGCDTFVTGEGSLYSELFAHEMGLSLVYASHSATEFPAICDFADAVAQDMGLEWVAISESPWITGGGRAPLEHGWSERRT